MHFQLFPRLFFITLSPNQCCCVQGRCWAWCAAASAWQCRLARVRGSWVNTHAPSRKASGSQLVSGSVCPSPAACTSCLAPAHPIWHMPHASSTTSLRSATFLLLQCFHHFISNKFTFILSALIPYAYAPYNAVGTITHSYRVTVTSSPLSLILYCLSPIIHIPTVVVLYFIALISIARGFCLVAMMCMLNRIILHMWSRNSTWSLSALVSCLWL